MTISTASFNDRLARIEAQQRATKGKFVLHVGEKEVLVRSLESTRKPQSRARTLLGNALFPLAFVGAFALGILAVVVSNIVRFQLMGVPGAAQLQSAGDAPMILGVVVSMAASMGLAEMFRLNSKVFTPAQSMGVMAGVTMLHNLAFWAPDLAAKAFTADWVALQQQIAAPNSLIFRGVIFPLFG